MPKPLFDSAFSYDSAFTFDSNEEAMKKYKSKTNYKSAFGHAYEAVSISDDEILECYTEESFLSKLSRITIVALCYLLAIILLPISIWICIKRIHALERLVILRLGRLKPVVGPGYYIVLPLIDRWFRVDLQPKTFSLQAQQILVADGAIVEVVATIKYVVNHAVHYVIKLHCQEKAIQELVQRCLTNFISGKEQTDLEKNLNFISQHVKTELNNTMVQWGLEILDVIIPPVRIIKEAEQVNVVNQIINVVSSAISGNQDSFSLPRFDSAPKIQENRASHDLGQSLSINNEYDLINVITNLINVANQKQVFLGLTATYKLSVQGEVTTVAFICVENGSAAVYWNESLKNEDITIILTFEDLQDFLSLKTSPLEAYFHGRIQVIGDTNLLKYIAEIFV